MMPMERMKRFLAGFGVVVFLGAIMTGVVLGAGYLLHSFGVIVFSATATIMTAVIVGLIAAATPSR